MFRNLSYRKLVFMATGPLLGDLCAALIVFWMNVQTVREGVPPRFQALIGTLVALGYTITALRVGRWSTPQRTSKLLTVSTILLAAIGTAVFLCSGFILYLFLSFVFGVVLAVYFVAFQVKMGHVRPFANVAWTVAFYNCSWGTGYACGPFMCGWFRTWSVAWVIAAVWVVLLGNVALIRFADGDGGGTPSDDPVPGAGDAATAGMRRMGWVAVLVAVMMYAGLVATLWPGLGILYGLSDRQIGIGVFVAAFQLPVWSLVFARFRARLMQPGFLVAVLILIGLLFVLIPFVPAWPWALLVLTAWGWGYSAILFFAVYCSNADPENPARSVGINESLIGVAGIVGPLVMGLLAWDNAASLRPYAFGLAASLVAGALVAGMDRRERRQKARLPVRPL